jgi:hypothetical protein
MNLNGDPNQMIKRHSSIYDIAFAKRDDKDQSQRSQNIIGAKRER